MCVCVCVRECIYTCSPYCCELSKRTCAVVLVCQSLPFKL